MRVSITGVRTYICCTFRIQYDNMLMLYTLFQWNIMVVRRGSYKVKSNVFDPAVSVSVFTMLIYWCQHKQKQFISRERKQTDTTFPVNRTEEERGKQTQQTDRIVPILSTELAPRLETFSVMFETEDNKEGSLQHSRSSSYKISRTKNALVLLLKSSICPNHDKLWEFRSDHTVKGATEYLRNVMPRMRESAFRQHI